jgi:hypothetical protein
MEFVAFFQQQFPIVLAAGLTTTFLPFKNVHKGKFPFVSPKKKPTMIRLIFSSSSSLKLVVSLEIVFFSHFLA